jgi:hypothetical protein
VGVGVGAGIRSCFVRSLFLSVWKLQVYTQTGGEESDTITSPQMRPWAGAGRFRGN